MKNEKIAAIKKSAKITATVVKVLRIIAIVGACICLVSGIVCLAMQGNADNMEVLYENGNIRILSPISDGSFVFSNGGFEFLKGLHIDNLMVLAGLNCFCGAALLAVIAVVFLIIGRVFSEIKDSDTPFTESIQKRIRFAGILVTILVAMESIGTAVIVGLSLWCVYCIFGYGMELQKAEDETL